MPADINKRCRPDLFRFRVLYFLLCYLDCTEAAVFLASRMPGRERVKELAADGKVEVTF